MTSDPEDEVVARRAGMDQAAAYHDEMASWLGARTEVLRLHGIPESIRDMILARLVEMAFPMASPFDDAMRLMIERLEREVQSEEEDDDE